ncbi:DoxX family protein [Streptomyces sp. 15-116A]|uniref:DoxX family protein n=1 Tax=Streptomyces sp. 15-116A TaxID=2259035 RepID=UPI0021B4715B|nr:DoxX family protein [Streptomyces sp. 15-116A]MCT7354261.1 DoxX family protein [Streptomyces sp. 15-116A]
MSETTAPVASAAPIAPAASVSRRRGRIALRVVQVLLAVFFAVASALPKLIAHSSAVASFDEMGWGHAGMYAIGLLELAGAIGLLVPVLQSVAAAGLGALMVGAFVVQVTVFDGQFAATPLILLVPLAVIAWARRGHTADLLRLLRRQA